MNWGKGIITGMVLFMLFIIGMCIHMFRMPADEYDHHYYEKGLRFNEDYDKEKQVVTDAASPVIRIKGDSVQISFTQPATGSVRFVRPSSAALDREFALNTASGKTATLSATALVRGRWKMVMAWKSSHKDYLYEQEVDLK
jgi:hypothetical protein